MQADRHEHDKDVPKMKGTTLADWEDYEMQLKRWLWQFGGRSSWTAETDPVIAAIYAPMQIPANIDLIRQHQMTLFQCLTHAFEI